MIANRKRVRVLMLMLLGMLAAWSQPKISLAESTSSVEPDRVDALGDEPAESHRRREGTQLVNQQGHFRATGDRLTFQPTESDSKYPGLENLAMERIAKVMSDRHDNPDQLIWEVSGFFTEYRGGNYLYITHAVLLDKSRRPSVGP